MADVTFHVYRFYSHDGELLYVGQTHRFTNRLSQHRKEKEWWAEVARIELDRCESKRGALEHERALIREHRPPYNQQLNPSPRPRPEARSAGVLSDPCDIPACPGCGAPELYLNFRQPATLCWLYTDGQPDWPPPDLNPPNPDWFRLDPEDLGVECSFCGDNWPVASGPDYINEAQARDWHERHPEAM